VKRREFIALLGGAVVAWPGEACAQPGAKAHRIGILGNEFTRAWEGMFQQLQDLGYSEGRNLTIVSRWSGGVPDRLPDLARELVQREVEVIVASGTEAARAAMQATATIPIVMAVSAYPEKTGLVQSLARPGGNVTGLSTLGPQLAGKRLELLKEIAPRISRVAFLFNPANPAETLWLQEVLAAAPAAGVTILAVELRTPSDHSTAFAAATSGGADGLFVVGNPVTFRIRSLIAEAAATSRLPAIYEERIFVEAGGLMAYAPSFTELFRRAALYVDKILTGAKPAELPVEQPTNFELVINLNAAKALGLTVPAALLIRADQVIE
jgi:putative ABC transport system substrate-binding protein